MKNKQLNRLLNTACEIITSLEHNADDDLMKTIDAMFNEIKYSDRIDDEMKVEEDDSPQDICDSTSNSVLSSVSIQFGINTHLLYYNIVYKKD